MREEDINLLLDEANENLLIIKGKYKAALTDESIRDILKVKVKTVLEHLRSSLDYCAHDIYDFYYSKNDGNTEEERNKLKIYFPYGKKPQNFRASLGNNFKKFNEIDIDMYDLLESIQPYKSNNNWLIDICLLTNTNKHNRLGKQVREDNSLLRVNNVNVIRNVGKSSHIELINCNFNGKHVNNIVMDKGRIIKCDGNLDSKIELINWVEFKFQDTDIDILNLLCTGIENIKRLKDNIYNILKRRAGY